MRNLSTNLIAQLYTESSDDPFLTLFTLNHTDWVGPIYLVNNTEAVISNGNTFEPFPVKVTLPHDDGETARKVSIEFDNVSLELIDELRSVTDSSIEVTIEMILASDPDTIEIEIGELKVKTVSYNAQTVKAELYMDDFLNTELSSEKYTPSKYSGLFT